MTKNCSMIVLTLMIAVCLLSPVDTVAARKLKVVTTLPDLASLTRAVGGDMVEISSIALGVQDPHYLEAKPSYQVRLSRADLLIYNGLSLEVGWLPLLVQGSRNEKIMPAGRGSLNASEAIYRILEKPVGEVDRSMGDIHPEGNPHYLLDPRNGVKVAELIRDRLKMLDPANSGKYDANYEAFETMMGKRIEEWEEKARALKGKKIVTYHKQWEYLADWLGLNIVAQVEDKPGIPPAPRHRAWLASMMKDQKIKVLLTANFTPGLDMARKLADETGARLLVLPASTEGEPQIREYQDLFPRLIVALADALKEEQ